MCLILNEEGSREISGRTGNKALRQNSMCDGANMENSSHQGIRVPNMIHICIDARSGPEISGKMYVCGAEAVPFGNTHTLLRSMNRFMDDLDYPQSSVSLRSYYPRQRDKRPDRPHNPSAEEVQRITEHRGKLATFTVYVKYRQNATWQGTAVHAESGGRGEFQSELEFLKIMDHLLAAQKASAEISV